MSDDKIKWHPAFASAIQLEFKEYKEHLNYIIEHELTQEPLKIDVVIIKKLTDIEIEKPIGKLLKKHNIFEYKSPTDYLSIDGFYKVKAYAYLYKVLSEGENSIDINDLTITLTSSRYPRKLIDYLKEKDINVAKQSEGVYYLEGNDIQTQMLIIKELSEESVHYLSLLQNKHERIDLLASWFKEYLKNMQDPLYEVIMRVLEKSNPNEIMEVYRNMNIAKLSKENEKFLLNAIEELELNKRFKEEGIKEGKYSVAKRLLMKGQDIDSIMDITELTREEVEKLIKEM